MKLNSKLWLLATALATVGCQDDLGNDANSGTTSNTLNGPTTYMTVSINSETTTKAPQNDNDVPEGGEGEGTETGNENEYDVDDITVVLYSPSTANITSTSDIVAVGYAEVGGTSASGAAQHSRQATVQLTVTEDNAGDFDGQTYGIIAITNLGADNQIIQSVGNGTIGTGADLADYLQTSAWSGSGSSSSANKFIMSSHMPNAETVTLDANANETNAPSATVHVERLAAKVRINESKGAEGFIYTIDGNNSAKVRLDEVAIVNQLNSGTYLLKRVSEEISDLTFDSMPSSNSDTYLADEEWVSQGLCNYVIDPWTRSKIPVNAETPGNVLSADGATALSYINHFGGDGTDDDYDYSKMWNDVSSSATSLAGTTETSPIFLCYTQENTTAAEYSLNGYSTGAIFKATYFPVEWAAINTDGDAVEAEETGISDIDASTVGKTFYVYQRNVYKDYDAIWAEYVWNLYGTDMPADALDYDDFKSDGISNVTIEAFNASRISEGADPLGYIKYLNSVKDERDDHFTADDSFEAYVAAHPRGTTDGETDGTAITVYENGEMYYPYWIRHGNNGLATTMGIMEFAIVRNNIYDMTVSSITGLGLSGQDKPDPEEENEDKDYYFNVNLLVRDWVVRSNDGIIL